MEQKTFDEQVGINIKRYREIGRMTQSDLAEASKVSKGYIYRLEHGNARPTTTILQNLAEALFVTVEDLVKMPSEEENTYEFHDGSNRINTFYPARIPFYKIQSMVELVLALPLLNPIDIFESLSRIEGDVIDKELYVCKQINYCYSRVPETDAKKYADFMIEILNRVKWDSADSYPIQTMMSKLDKGFDCPEMKKYYDEYCREIISKLEIYKMVKNLMEEISNINSFCG